ncbi:MAG: hypothetical protein HY342_00010 [Candidatus Lambdaproteobacteria bacterium]|nr:hypothetical protein [Candidatus Lambdaproteobacteria bacterium]
MQARKLKIEKSSARKSMTYQLSILFIENDGGWSAQCLEHDVAAQAKTLDQLYYEVERVLVAQIALAEELSHEPFRGLGPAPQKYWDIFKESRIEVKRPAARQLLLRPKIRVAERVAA